MSARRFRPWKKFWQRECGSSDVATRGRYRRRSLWIEGLESRELMAADTVPDSRGTDFWLAFPENLSSDPVLTLFLSGETDAEGTVEIPGQAFSTPFTVTAGQITSVVIPAAAQLTESDVVEDKGIHVTSDNSITIYGLNRVQFTTDAFLGLPTDILGTEYIVLTYGNKNVAGTQLGVVATEDDTTVTITPSVTVGARTEGVPFEITLNAGQAYQLVGPQSGDDMTGTIITSDAPVGVYGSHLCANIPTGGTGFCDYLVEQLTPTSTWGQAFLTMPLATRLNGDTMRFLASADDTTVQVNGATVATLDRGEVFEQLVVGPARITANQPILVGQYSNGTQFDGVVSDPFFMLVPPFEQFQGGYQVTTPASGFRTNFINIVAPTSAVGFIEIDGVAVAAGTFQAIGASGFSGAQVPVELGQHSVTDSRAVGAAFGVFVYGFDTDDSYGYPGGLLLAPIAQVSNVVLEREPGPTSPGSQITLKATVTDDDGNPLAGIRVDFTVTGANEASGFGFTDENGVARFQYIGDNGGTDNARALVGELGDELQINRSGAGAILAVSGDLARKPFVQVYDIATGDLKFQFLAYEKSFRGGVRVATGDINLDGVPDIVTAPGPGRPTEVRVFSGIDGTELVGLRIPPMYGKYFYGGLRVAVGDYNGDGKADIGTLPGVGKAEAKLFRNRVDEDLPFLYARYVDAFADYKGWRGISSITIADLDGPHDGNSRADVIIGATIYGNAIIRAFEVKKQADSYQPILQIDNPGRYFGESFSLTAGDTNGDGRMEIIAGAGVGGQSIVKVFKAKAGSKTKELASFQAFSGTWKNAYLNVVAKDINGNGTSELFAAQGYLANPSGEVRLFKPLSGKQIDAFFADEENHIFRGVDLG